MRMTVKADAGGLLGEVISILKITPAGVVSAFTTITGGGIGLAFDWSGNLYAVNYAHSRIYKITADGAVSTFASGVPIASPSSLAADAWDNIYAGNQGYGNATPTIRALRRHGALCHGDPATKAGRL